MKFIVELFKFYNCKVKYVLYVNIIYGILNKYKFFNILNVRIWWERRSIEEIKGICK